jgi:hypothetical protein
MLGQSYFVIPNEVMQTLMKVKEIRVKEEG